VYLDAMASSPLDPRVKEVVCEAFDRYPANPGSLHQEGREARKALEHAREKVARALDALPMDVVFTSGGSEGNTHALHGLARALADGLKRVAARKPLLIVLDTYEIVDRADVWLREVMRAAGPRVVWVISGRDDLTRSRQFGDEYFKGYSEEFPRRLIARDMLQLAQQDLREIFADAAPNRPLSNTEAQAFSRATRGVPLAIAEAAEMWGKGIALEEIIGNIDDATPRDQIVNKMTDRYFRHVPEADKPALYALALARGDVEILRAMLHLEGDGELRRLERDYASVHYDKARLHNDAEFFLREHLKAPLQRTDAGVRTLLQRAVEVLRARLEKLQRDLPRLEDRCADEDWRKATLDLCDYLFWLDESEAWHYFIPRFVESLAYSRELRRGLVEEAKTWRNWLSASGKKRARVLHAGVESMSSMLPLILPFRLGGVGNIDAQDEMLDELTRLEKLGYLQGDGEAERRAILDWQRGKLFYARGRYTEALAAYERAERALPADGEALQRQLGEGFWEVGEKLAWVWDEWRTVDSLPSKEAEFAFNRAIECGYVSSSLYQALGAVQIKLGKLEESLKSRLKAIELDPQNVYAYNGIGNVQSDLGNYEAALAAYTRAIELDPKFAYPHYGIGNVHQLMGEYEKALRAYQKAVELAPERGMYRGSLAGILRKLGREEEAQAQIQIARPLMAKENEYNRACFESICGNVEEALRMLKIAIEIKPSRRELARRDPDFDWIREDARFKALVEA
jgi:tetratricopeptide (TPR) repeat protein